jgi:hypothetical protein
MLVTNQIPKITEKVRIEKIINAFFSVGDICPNFFNGSSSIKTVIKNKNPKEMSKIKRIMIELLYDFR